MRMTCKDEKSYYLEKLIDERFIKPWQTTAIEEPAKRVSILEFQITYDCNLKCEYCYVNRFGEKLYPKAIRNRENILNNLGIYLDYLISLQPINIPEISLFSGEIWGEEFGYQVLEIIYQKLKTYKLTEKVMIPTNCSFLLEEKWKNKLQEYIDKYSEIGVRLLVSASIDGAPIESEVRSFKDENKNDLRTHDFYDTVFNFTTKNKSGHHPMVAAYKIEKWKDNYKWWCEMGDKYNFPVESTMMLEVRNDDWDEEKINHYLDYLNYNIDYTFKKFNENKEEFINYIFKLPNKYRKYCNISLAHFSETSRCSIQRALMIRLGDLTITPCHRLSYDHLNYGKYIVENGKIIGIEGKNVELATKILFTNPAICSYGCDTCPYASMCILGCYGSQYENTGEIFAACSSVCNMLKAKINFLIDKYSEMGIFDYYMNMDLNGNEHLIKRRAVVMNDIKNIQRYRNSIKEVDGNE